MDQESYQVGEECLDCKALGEEKTLKYFFINCVDRIIKCESDKCLYPYVFDEENDDSETSQGKENIENNSAMYANVENGKATCAESETAEVLNSLISEISFDLGDIQLKSSEKSSDLNPETPMPSNESGTALPAETEIPKPLLSPKVENVVDIKEEPSSPIKLRRRAPRSTDVTNRYATSHKHIVEARAPRRSLPAGNRSKKPSTKIDETKVAVALPCSMPTRRSLKSFDTSTTKIQDTKVKAAPNKSTTKISLRSKTQAPPSKGLPKTGLASQPKQQQKKTKVSNYFQKINALDTSVKKRAQPLKKTKIKAKPTALMDPAPLSSLEEIRKLVQRS